MLSFLDELKHENKITTIIENTMLDDNFLNIYKSKFIALDLKLPHNKCVASSNKNDPNKINENPIISKTISTIYHKDYFKFYMNKSRQKNTTLDDIYTNITDINIILINKKNRIIDQLIKTSFVSQFDNYFSNIIDLSDAIGYLYIGYKVLKFEKPFFKNIDYVVNKINNKKSKKVVFVVNIDTTKNYKHIIGISQLLQHIINNNVKKGGTLVFHYFFAPWKDIFNDHIFNIIRSYFTSIKLIFPQTYLSTSNKIFYVCKNKYSLPRCIDQPDIEKKRLLKFAKTIAYFNLANQKIYYILLNAQLHKSFVTILENKLNTHFNNLPLIKYIK
jgi:hypothetical protein